MGAARSSLTPIMKCVAVLLAAVLTATGSPVVPMDYDDSISSSPEAGPGFIGNSAGNFRCNVNSIQLITDQTASPEVKDAFDESVILNHFGKPQDLDGPTFRNIISPTLTVDLAKRCSQPQVVTLASFYWPSVCSRTSPKLRWMLRQLLVCSNHT